MGEFKEGDKVAIAGRRGTFVVIATDKPDGSVLVYGGDKNPNGKQGYRSVMPDKLKRAK